MSSDAAITNLAAARLPGEGGSGASRWYVLSGGGGTVRWWPAGAGQDEVDAAPARACVPASMAAARLADGTAVVVARVRLRLRHEDRNCLLRWYGSTGAPLGDPVTLQAPHLRPGMRDPLAVVAGADGPAAVTTAAGGAGLRCWDLATGKPAGGPFARRHLLVAALASGSRPDGAPLVVSSGADGLIRRHDPASGDEIGIPIRGCGRVVALAVTRLAGRSVVCVLSSRGYVHRRDLLTGEPAGPRIVTGWRPDAHAPWCSDGRMAVAATGGGGVIATCTDASTVRLWDLASGEPRGSFGETGPPGRRGVGPVRLGGLAAAYLPDGTPLVVTGGRDGTVRRYDARDGRPAGGPLRPHVMIP